MKQRLQAFMAGRYGVDHFSRFLNISSLIFLFAGIITVPPVTAIGLAGIVYNYFRIFSKDRTARIRENQIFLKQQERVIKPIANAKLRFSQRKTHRIFKCPSCKKLVRVPKGKGLIAITCPVCKTSFDRRT